ncbi:MAG: PKD domain-containing protein, partial [Bacteroidetes bacterium]|nr:PKD domain-containing protein [Bacteroidota bacterium]
MKKSFLVIALIAIIFGSCKKDKPSTPSTPIVVTPVANFTFARADSIAPCTVTFTNTSTNATSYVWNFGDSTATDTTVNPIHIFTTDGVFTVQLTATSSSGSNSVQKTVNVL